MKTEIIEGLGQTDLLLPSLIAEGLAANDRVKVRLSILQAAARRVRDPQAKRFDLENECRVAGINPAAAHGGELRQAPGVAPQAAAFALSGARSRSGKALLRERANNGRS